MGGHQFPAARAVGVYVYGVCAALREYPPTATRGVGHLESTPPRFLPYFHGGAPI